MNSLARPLSPNERAGISFLGSRYRQFRCFIAEVMFDKIDVGSEISSAEMTMIF